MLLVCVCSNRVYKNEAMKKKLFAWICRIHS